MAETEGVIKFRLQHRAAPPVLASLVAELSAWRRILHRLRLIGQDPGRYDGLGFGNMSRRLDRAGSATGAFVITGTQTGALETLDPGQYAVVLAADPDGNGIESQGPVKPSSEALTHAAVYLADPAVDTVIHVHCPEIWRYAENWGLAVTDRDIPYGTPEMARAVLELFESGTLRSTPLFAMLGHQDGIVSFGPDPAAAAHVLIHHLARALTPIISASADPKPEP